ncbi:MAG: SDR family NAD(P)-dependent oxidoreductase [Akkermansiaceae bacterium]|nr:SDR family NAD(P)-dependent oxidoreductase [Armatimonadota bacterium]
MSRTWFITGTSTGFGRELAVAALDAGNKVVATARKPEVLSDLTAKYGEKVLAVRLDITSQADIDAAVKSATDTFGQIDVLVNNAGYGVFGGFEEITEAQLRAQYETNVFGTVAVTRAVLPQMRARKSGHILNVSSTLGLVSIPGTSAYASSKFAVEGISEALAAEVAPLGIKVIIVEPGAFKTAFGATGVPKGDNPVADYAATAGAVVAGFEDMVANGSAPGNPVKAAQAMLAIVDDPNPALRLMLGSDALGMVTQKLDGLKANLERYAHITNSTNFDAEFPLEDSGITS